MSLPLVRLTGEITLKFSADEPGFICVDDLLIAEHARCVFGEGNETCLQLGKGTVTIALAKDPRPKWLPGQRQFWEGDHESSEDDC